MKAVIDAIVGLIMVLGLGSSLGALYQPLKRASLLKVHQGLPSLEKYTQKLTGTKLNY